MLFSWLRAPFRFALLIECHIFGYTSRWNLCTLVKNVAGTWASFLQSSNNRCYACLTRSCCSESEWKRGWTNLQNGWYARICRAETSWSYNHELYNESSATWLVRGCIWTNWCSWNVPIDRIAFRNSSKTAQNHNFLVENPRKTGETANLPKNFYVVSLSLDSRAISWYIFSITFLPQKGGLSWWDWRKAN